MKTTDLKFNHRDILASDHLLKHFTYGKSYQVQESWSKHVMLLNDCGQKVWVSNKMKKKYFKENL